jgi:hypothetical protein
MKSIVYDKAKYHYEGIFPEDLDIGHAYTHTGMYLGWLIDNNLVSEEFINESIDSINEFKARKMTPIEIYEEWDGCLVDDMLNEEGNNFSAYYYTKTDSLYIDDYLNVLIPDEMPSIYNLNFTWESYDKICKVINIRYEKWKEYNNQKKKSYELSIELHTDKPLNEIYEIVLRYANSIADYTDVSDGTIRIYKIAASFGSINRDDAAFFQFQPIKDGYRCVAYVMYKPSIMCWILLFLLLGTGITWIIPVLFYYSQKNTVRNAVQNLLYQVRFEIEANNKSAVHTGESESDK